MNPAREVKTPKFSRSEGKTPAPPAEEVQKLIDSIDLTHIVGLRDQAIPGVLAYTFARIGAAAVRWLRQAATGSRRVGSICTGAFLLAHAGLLDGRRAATHWAFAAELAKRYPKVNVDPEPIWIQDDNFYTSAGVTAGIDLSLALLEEDHGAALALEVARVLVVFLRRPGNQAQFSVSLGTQSMERKPLHELRVWMVEHLTADLSVPALAQRVAMSPRNFQRVFTSEAGKWPARAMFHDMGLTKEYSSATERFEVDSQPPQATSVRCAGIIFERTG